MTPDERKAWDNLLSDLREGPVTSMEETVMLSEPLRVAILAADAELTALRARVAVLEKDLRISQAGIDRSVLDALTSKGCPRCSTIKEAKGVD